LNPLKADKDTVYGGKAYLEGLVSEVKPLWYSKVKRFRLEQRQGVKSKHMFFDPKPKLNSKSKFVSVVVTTPSNSRYEMELDTKSGQIFYTKEFCGTYDSSKKFSGVITRPNFSIGLIPRYLDQLNSPQKVLIFGGEKYVSKYHMSHSIDVRIIGGYVERVCLKGACLDPDDWVSRLVAIAVFKGDEKLKSVESIAQLKEEIDWDYTLAFLKNGFGKNSIANNYYGAYQVGNFVDSFRTFNYIKTKSNYFDSAKIATTKKSCYELYDYTYKFLSYKGVNDLKTNTIVDLKNKKVIKAKLKKIGSKGSASFSKRFKQFYDKYREDFTTCSKFVYNSNINDNVTRHWYFAYLESVFKLVDLGFSYSCTSENWVENAIFSTNKKMYSNNNEFRSCSNKAIQKAFELAPNILEQISLRAFNSYKYITYDKLTHQKIYSWVNNSNKKFKCSKDNKNIFPTDIRWEK
jgi:hypothetical protein